MGSKIKRSFDLKFSANYRKLCLATESKIIVHIFKKKLMSAAITTINRAVVRTENPGVPVVMYWAYSSLLG